MKPKGLSGRQILLDVESSIEMCNRMRPKPIMTDDRETTFEPALCGSALTGLNKF